MGQAALLNAEALSLAGYEVELLDYDPAKRAFTAYGRLASQSAPTDPSDLVLVQLNPPQCSQALQAFLHREGRRRRQIGFWVWETEEAPRSWRRHASAFDEIWTPSRFCAHALRRFSAKLRVMPHPCGLRAPDPDGLEDQARARARLGLEREAFVVAFSFDMRSSFRRKNALGLVEAFRRAFRPATTARLLIRVLSREVYPAGWSELYETAGHDPAIVLLDERSEIVDLYRACDVYASLHRSEGFGMTLAEAMLNGRPVVATGWSGNLDFMDEDTAWLIPFNLVPVIDAQGAYAADQRWAEPDLDSAARALRDLADSPGLRRALGEKGRAAILRGLSRLPDSSIASRSNR